MSETSFNVTKLFPNNDMVHIEQALIYPAFVCEQECKADTFNRAKSNKIIVKVPRGLGVSKALTYILDDKQFCE